MLNDLRYAVRSLRRRPMFTLVAVVTVALGVGANTAVFSLADSVLFRPLPFADVGRLFVLRMHDPRTGQVYGTLPGSAVTAAEGTGLFDAMAPVSGRSPRAYVRTAEGLDALTLMPVSRQYLELLGIRTVAGRTFDASDAGTRAVVLTYGTWMRRYGGDPAVVGRLIPSLIRSIDGSNAADPPLHVVGILPPALHLPLLSDEDGLVLMESGARWASRPFPPLVHLRSGVTPAAAQAQLTALSGPDLVPGQSELRLVPLREELASQQDSVLWLLVAASATILLVACVNLANLLMARGSARARELAVRSTLGASRQHLVRLLVAENLWLAAIGGASGIAVAYWGFRLLSRQLPPLLAATAEPSFDLRTLAFAIASTSIAAVVFGVLPAVRVSRADARDGLRLGQLQTPPSPRGRHLLVALEVAICLALTIGAGLIGRSLLALLSEDLGFEAHRIIATFDLPTLVVKSGDAVHPDLPARAAFVKARLAEVRRVPGVRAAGAAYAAPFLSVAPDAPLMDGPADQAGGIYPVSSGYFHAIGAPLLAGRDLTDDESFAAAPIGVLNDMAARIMFGSPSAAIGRVVQAQYQPPRTVVGVVRDVRRSIQRKALPAMYVPFNPSSFIFATIVIDSTDTPESRAGLKRALSASPDARVEVRSLDDSRDRELSPFRFNAIIVGSFAGLALALAIVGVYGVTAAVVGERVKEYGIRIALGATRGRLHRHVVSQSAIPIGAGVAGGLVLAAWTARFVASLLYGIEPMDAVSFAGAALLVLASGLAAAFIPAIRAGRVDPMIALRAE